MSRLHLIAASDDYLLEESLGEAIAEVVGELPGVSPAFLSDEISPEDLATDAKGNVYIVDSAPRAKEFVSIRVLVGGDPRKAVPLSTEKARRLAVLPNGDLLVMGYSTLWQFKMKRKVEDLVRRR